jgi:hypothetical protein
VDAISVDDFLYYDKDGFELNLAEQKYYSAMNYPINHPILNHTCWQEPWFSLQDEHPSLHLDHSMFLCRASYQGAAREQLRELQSTVPLAGYLLKTKQKWGFDIALDDQAPGGDMFEVIHIEFDSYDYDEFRDTMMYIEYRFFIMDWQLAAQKIWSLRDKWQHLKGFDQNHWKANYLLGWDKAEYTEKSV